MIWDQEVAGSNPVTQIVIVNRLFIICIIKIMWKTWKSPYEIFTDPDELKIGELIQQRRYQMLIHSCIYYHLNDNCISDKTWNDWAHELADLQDKYPEISKRVTLYEYFKDWDGSSGAFLPINLDWVVKKSQELLFYRDRHNHENQNDGAVDKSKNKKSLKRKLF